MSNSSEQQPNCMRCRHHQITHELPFRYACLAIGFKSARQPCRDVLENSGQPCQYFAPRAGDGRNQP